MKKNVTIFIFTILSLLLSTSATFAQSQMTMTTDATIIRLGLAGTGDIIIDWGNGTSKTTATLTNNPTNYWYNYFGSSIYIITITGANVTYLSCGSNYLRSLDVSNNSALEILSCDYNQLTSLNLTNNRALVELRCDNNELTSLDVSNNSALETLQCSGNKLTSLDVSNNRALITLSCGNNLLTSLNVTKNIALRHLSCYSNLLTILDVNNNSALIEFDCSVNQLTSLDVSNNSALTYLYCPYNNLTSLDVSNNSALEILQCGSNQLTSLNANNSSALINLSCPYNNLTSLDVSNNSALRSLRCDINLLMSLDVSKNSALTELLCSHNLLTILDVTNNSALEILSCYYNELTSLDVSNNRALITLSCDNNLLTSLDVRNKTALRQLSCSDNLLTSLDVSNNSELLDLWCSNNLLTSLDVTNNSALTVLWCEYNQLTSAGLDALFGTLNSSTSTVLWGKTIYITDNPGTNSCNRCIATNKGWIVRDFEHLDNLNITISTSSLAFGDVSINNTKELIVTITNNGNANITISSIDITGTWFTIVSGGSSGSLVGFASRDVVVQFSPNATGAYTGSITFTHNGNCSPHTINLTGNGVDKQISVEYPEDIDGSTFLFQSNPNPVRSGYDASIRYRLTSAGQVTLVVYDLLGREVAKLVNDYKPRGMHSASLNTKNLPSGVYFYKLKTPDYEGFNKMLIIR